MFNYLNKVVIVFLLLMFLSISAVSAQENTISEIGLNENTETMDVEEIVEENLKAEPNDDSAITSESGEKDDSVNVASVEMNEDNLKGSGSSFADLQNLINKANSGAVINLYKDYSYSPGNSEIVINKSITIDGKNHVLDGKLSTRILHITGNYVTLKNIRFINANITNDNYNGAIYWEGTNGFLKSCSFANNHADFGSAVYWYGDNGILEGCSFFNNHVRDTGVVYWKGTNGFLKGCSFANNHANNNGGAVFWFGKYGNLGSCSFVNNHANSYGGAVLWGGDYGNLGSCSFANNHAHYGGAVSWPGDNGFLKGCSFVNNHANSGGAVYCYSKYSNFSSCYFVNNTARYFAGAIYLHYNNTNVFACSFRIYRPKNTATVKVNNLIYYPNNNYWVDYLENDNFIKYGHINDASVTFYNLDNGKHSIDMIYRKGIGFASSFTNYIIIIGDSYISGRNIYMFYNDGTKCTIKLADHKGNPIINQNVQITIGSANYNVKTDVRGYAMLTIKQKVGKYSIISKFDGSMEYGPSTVVHTLSILDSPITKNKNLKIYFGGIFKVQIINLYGNSVGARKYVKFKIGMKRYIRKTDKWGYASLKIFLKPRTKKYSIIIKYDKFIKKNNITVKPVLTANDIVVKKRKTIKFSAKLVNTKGKPRAKETIRFTLKRKTYKVKTNKKGRATLKIKNLKKGKYEIYTQYGKSKIKNTIKIE